MDRKMVNFIKEQYPPGTHIRLNSTVDPYAPVAPGTEGEVDFVDDMIFDFYGEENSRQLEEYQKTPDQGMTMGGM